MAAIFHGFIHILYNGWWIHIIPSSLVNAQRGTGEHEIQAQTHTLSDCVSAFSSYHLECYNSASNTNLKWEIEFEISIINRIHSTSGSPHLMQC